MLHTNHAIALLSVVVGGAGVTDCRQRIPRQTAVAPPHAVLDTGSATTLSAEFEANDLTSYFVDDTARLTDVVITSPTA
jgi:hypothetical protein